EQEIHPVGFAPDFFEKGFDLSIVRDVARKQRRFFAERGGQFLHVFLQTLALVIENQTRAGIGPGLGDRPRDAAFVRDTKDNSNLSFQHRLRHKIDNNRIFGGATAAMRLPQEHKSPSFLLQFMSTRLVLIFGLFISSILFAQEESPPASAPISAGSPPASSPANTTPPMSAS